ncbi:symplekin [Cylas formicarius]|uniref:symplekin n=1 Tax=Cylas formicarius TaxID=197179 RepID=UPI00295849CF|nr:symplekin [Cylas formicarius]
MSEEELVVQYINNSLISTQVSEKVQNFCRIKELLLHRTPSLLSKYLVNVLNFATEKNPEIKKSLVGFIEELCKVRESLIPNVMVTLHMLLCDESIAVQKRVIQATITIYRRTLAWLCKAPSVTEEMERGWNQLNTIKLEIANMIDSDNDGIRTSSVKFLECVVLLQTYPDETENKKSNDFSLDNIPLTLKIARRRKLEEEASNLFELLVKFHGSPHISSANLLACIGVLTNVAKNRAAFMGRVIEAIESLYNNLPPTLTTTQVSSVKKKLKTELAALIKHPAAFEYISRLTPLLLDLGYLQQDINKMIPKAEERRKYQRRTLSLESSIEQLSKRPRLEQVSSMDYDDTNDSNFPSMTPQEVNEKFIMENLTIEKAIYLIFTNVPKLPNIMPASFVKDYGKYVLSGRIGREYLAEALAAQFLAAKVGPGADIIVEEKIEELKKDNEPAEKVVPKKEKVKVPKIKSLKLTEVTKPLPKDIKEKLLVGSVKRLLLIDKTKSNGLHQKIITTLASSFTATVRETILTYLLSDLRSNIDTVLAWLFEEYSIMQGFTRIPPLRKGVRPDECYNILLCTFIQCASHDVLTLSRLILEVPMVTEEALEEIKLICRDERRSAWVLGLLRDLIIRKPPKQLMFLNTLLLYTTYESNSIRDAAIGHILDLHKYFDLRLVIEEFAKMNLEFLKLPKPPQSLGGDNQGRIKSESWNEDFIKASVLPYVSLLPVNPTLIHELTKVYVDTNAEIKRVILRLIEQPIRNMGMDCSELMKLVEECPKGSETLVTRVIHILTDRGTPSAELVSKVRDLYNSRISDVRFLIPVLSGLSKKEIISALPKLIKLNPVVVREVFNRLLGLHGETPISPVELLVSLHLIDNKSADLKTVIKAISLCLQEKQVYTQEILAVVLQQLMDQIPLPTLLMRTVIQALGSYPRLSGFVMNILQRLILKQVWKQKIVWEGFIKCCQRTKPQSFAVLMQLPPAQLTEVLTSCPDLATPLRDHLSTFTEAQRVHIPATVQEVILGFYSKPSGLTSGVASNGKEAVLSQSETISLETHSSVPPSASASAAEPLPPGME